MINEHKKGVRAVKHTAKAKGTMPKPGNPIAVAHQKTGGSKSGAHKDKKKEIPRKAKHKTADYAEHLNTMLKQAINEEGLSPQKRLQLIQFISQTKGWDVSDVSLASDPELIDMYKKIKAGQDLDETDHAHEFKVGQKAEYVGLHSKLPPFPVVVTNVDGDYIEFRSASGQPIPGTNGETEWSGDPGWKVLKPSRTYNPNSLVGATSRAESWTHDSLAAELFEQELTYEDRLHNMLAGKVAFMEASPTPSKKKIKENQDYEGGMARGQLMGAAKQAIELAKQMDEHTQLDAWVQTKISLAQDYIDTVYQFLMNNKQDVDRHSK